MNVSKFILIAFAFILLINNTIYAQNSVQQQHIEVSLRMVGHQFLLSLGDSTSRILPIKKENNRYQIQFETEFEFNPEDLVSTVDEVFKKTKISNGYILEVEECDSGEVVYSYEISKNDSSDIIPCRVRALPKGCYRFYFTLTAPKETIVAADGATTNITETPNNKNNNLIYYIIAFILIVGGGIVVYLKRNKNKEIVNPNIISLGNYQFNKRNGELLFGKDKIELTSKEADLLMLLYNEVNTTVEREIILQRVWGDEGDYIGRTLDVFISKLRKKLEADSAIKLVNIRGVGYKLVMDV
jgi:DNA-binding winged helix-turn-helix (wHTH) protein